MQKVLLLEDDLITVDLLTLLLEEAGYKTAHADNTDAAVELLENFTPDIFLSDWSIDGSVNAHEVARKVRNKNPQAKVIFVTGHSSDDLTPELADLGQFKVYQKPVEYEHIVDTLALN